MSPDLSPQDLDRITVLIAIAVLAISGVFIWSFLALVGGSWITLIAVCLLVAIPVCIVVGKLLTRRDRYD
jgi:cytochrome b subunit of formate dehydrogenase